MSELFALDCNNTIPVDGDGEEVGIFGDLEWLWLVGVGCAVVSSVATAIGTILQKKAHMIQEALPDDKKSPEFIGLVFNKYWFFALIIMVAVPLPFDFASFALAPQSVITPMTGLTIVLNQVFAPYILGEKLSHIEAIGTVIILAGVVMVAVTAGGNPEELNVCEIVARYADPEVVSMVFVLVGCIFLNLFWVATHRHPAALEALRPEMYAFIAGGLGALMQVAFKATGELVKGEAGPAETNTWNTIWPYFHIAAVAVLAVGMISAINYGLQTYDAVLFSPLYFTNLIVLSSSLGLVFYREYANFNTWQFVLYPLGISIVVSGILFMTLKGVDLPKVRARVARLQRSKANRRSLHRSMRAESRASRAESRASGGPISSLRLPRPLSLVGSKSLKSPKSTTAGTVAPMDDASGFDL